MDTDIRDEIERSFGDGPPLAAADDLLVRGRRALRRRRLAETGAVLATAVVVIGGAAIATGGHQPDAAQPMAPSATTAPTPTPEPSASALFPDFPPPPGAEPVPDRSLTADWPLEIRADGLHVRPSLRILRQVDDPWDERARGGWSVAVVYRDGRGPLIWWAGNADADLGGGSASIPAKYARTESFASWVEAQRPVTGDPSPTADPPGDWPGITNLDLVRFADSGERLEPLDAVTLLEQRPHPDLPATWAGDSDRSAVAEVEFEGTRYYVLGRQLTGDAEPQFITVKAERGGATLDDFLRFARERYAEGGGGLL
jgi:hypothetical protein